VRRPKPSWSVMEILPKRVVAIDMNTV
jgi:hypothetical protein